MERTISLDDTHGSARSRVLALALAELARTAGDAPSTDSAAPSPPTPPEPPTAVAPPRSVATRSVVTDAPVRRPEPSPRWRVGVDARARVMPTTRDLASGGGMSLRWARWHAGAELLLGGRSVALGHIDFGVAAATVSFDVLHLGTPRFDWRLSPGIALGATWLHGSEVASGFEAENMGALYADARLAFTTELRDSALLPHLSLEAGRARGLAATRRGQVLAATGGWFLGACFGVSLNAW